MLTIVNGLVLKGLNLDPVRENILIANGKILEIAPNINEGEIIDATNCIISPTFLNGHTHIGDSIIKDEGDGLSLSEMVQPPDGIKHIALEQSEPEDIINNMKVSMVDMLLSGTTHFIDYREGGVEGVKLVQKASIDIPINPIILGRDSSFYGDDPDMSQVKKQLRKLLNIADGIGLSGFGEVSTEVAELITSQCAKKNKISSIHAGESASANNKSIDKTGLSEIERAIDMKFDQVVHGTQASDDDIKKIKESNTNLVLCPRANATLNLGIPPIKEILNNNISPFMGSDNLMLNSPNMMRDLEFSLKLTRAYFKEYFNPKDFLKMTTTNPSKFMLTNERLYNIIGKSVIGLGNDAQLMITKQISKNPYLSIINRCETQNILYVMNKDKLVDYSN